MSSTGNIVLRLCRTLFVFKYILILLKLLKLLRTSSNYHISIFTGHYTLFCLLSEEFSPLLKAAVYFCCTSLPALKWHSSSSFLYTALDGSHSLRPAASSSHGVRHPVDHIHHGESERKHGPGIDVDGICINGLADTLGTALLLLFLVLLRLPGSSPPRLRLLRSTLPGNFAAGTLGSTVAAGNDHALIHAGD